MNKINRYVDIIGELLFLQKLGSISGIFSIYDLINNEKNKKLEYYDYLNLAINGLTDSIKENQNSFISEMLCYIILEDMTCISDYKWLKKEIINISEKYTKFDESDKNRIEDMLFEYRKCHTLTQWDSPVYKDIDSFKSFNVKINFLDINIKNVHKINNFSDEEIIHLLYCNDIKTEVLCMLNGKKFFSVKDKFIKGDFLINYNKIDELRKKFIDKIF